MTDSTSPTRAPDSVLDMTERRQAEIALSRSEQRYRTLFNEIDEGFCIIEFLDTPHGPLSDYVHVEANPAYARHTGIANVVGQKLRDMVPIEAEGWLARYRPVLLTGIPVRFEQTLEATGRRLELAAFRIEPPELRQVAVLFTDVTARWKAEQALRESEARAREYADALREVDRRKNEFLAMLAHELRGPLAPISNMVELMKRVPDDPEVARQARTTIERQHATLHRLVDDLLDLNRITRDALVLVKQRVELRAIVEQAVEMNAPLALAAQQQVVVQLPGEAVLLDGDAVRLTQVLGNLLHNACKYSEPGGRITVRATRERGEVVVTVSDTGIGIPPERIGEIFQMFVQVDKTLERARGGLGIGLTLVKRLVELHGGTVTARSGGAWRGSEFEVRLPIAAGAHAAPAERQAAAPLAARRILVVDDNVDTAASLVMLLHVAGHEAEAANDARQALELGASWRPSIVLMDIGLPGMSGYDACRAMRAQPWGRDLLIVAVSGWGQEEDRRKSRDAGFDDHLVKPVLFEDLMEVLRSHASRPNRG